MPKKATFPRDPKRKIAPSNPCCGRMRDEFKRTCDEHEARHECPDLVLDYNETIKRFGILIHDGGSSVYLINYCPWCGTKL